MNPQPAQLQFNDRRADLYAEAAEVPSTARMLEIRLELDGLFVDEQDLQPGDFVHADGSITRCEP